MHCEIMGGYDPTDFVQLRKGTFCNAKVCAALLPGNGGTISFQYDPFGRRIEKISPANTTVYSYDGDNVEEELNASGTPVAEYTQGLGIDEPLAMNRASATSFYQADGLGSVTSLTDGSGQIAASYTYDAFGNLTASTGAISNPFRYTGREYDSETGLHYYRARYYDPLFGRFLSEDPIGFNGGVNFYSYTVNSPINFIDPSGNRIVVTGNSNAWLTAKVYLCTSPAGCGVITELEGSSEVYIINISDTYDIDQQTGGWRVFWNPHQAECVKNGVQSPALQLLHELTHLLQWKHGTQESPQREDQAVQATNPAAKQLGEPPRLNYHDALGHSTWKSPFPSGAKEECKCQNPFKAKK